MKHSELPWEVRPSEGNYRQLEIYGKNDEAIAEMFHWLGIDDFAEQEANAQFIVKACNNYYQLLNACKMALGAFENNNAINWDDIARSIKEAEE